MQQNRMTSYLQHQSFQPGRAAVFTNPFYLIRRPLFKNIRRLAPQLKGRLLDFGCGRKPYENLFTADEYVGVDMQQTGHDHSLSKVDVYYDGRNLPFPDASFDSLFCSEVMEHVFEPDAILQEVNRVLKPGAKALITVPFCWNEHETPYDYGRYTSFGITHLLEQNGFRVISLKKSGSFVPVIAQLWALYFFEKLRRFGRAGYALSMLLIIPINLAGVSVLRLFPRNDSLYFNNIVLAEKTANATA